MKYVLSEKENRRQHNLFRQFGVLTKMGIKFMKLLKRSH